MALVNALGDLALDATVQQVVTRLYGKLDVAPQNAKTIFRESFETFTPGVNWNLVTGDGDIVQLDGNAVSASYLVISKDPLSAGTETSLTYTGNFAPPIELAIGMSMSQRALGQEVSMEVVSTDTPLDAFQDVEIASISQTTTTLTVDTKTPHELVPGKRIGIRDVSNSLLNYPALVVASILSPTRFTATAGPGGTIASLTIAAINNSGYVFARPAMGYARDGISQVFESATATYASIYTRSNSGDALPSGVAAGNHSVSVSTTASTQAIISPYTNSFLPASEYRIVLQGDRAQLFDSVVDNQSLFSSRLIRTQVVPDATKQYTLRFRARNNKSLSRPVGRIVSISKSGTTTATIRTDVPHNLTTTSYVMVHGVRDQTNFANSTAQVIVSSIIDAYRFTVVLGTAVTATSYGGFVQQVHGSNVMPGIPSLSVQTAQVTNNELILVAGATWPHLIGDYVNAHGVIDVNGNSLGVDGVYKVVDVSTTTTRLAPIDPLTVLPTLALTNAGGTAIKRTDVRIAFVRIVDYVRERVEMQPQPAASLAAPVTVTNTVAISGSPTMISPNAYSLLTSTNLAASATYTSSAINAAATTTSLNVYSMAVSVSVQHKAGLTPGHLVFEIGTETSSTAPTVWYPQFVTPIASHDSWQTFTFPLTARYYRIRFINGATAQTSFRLATMTLFNGALGNNLTFPDYIMLPLSTTNLTSAGVFTGPTLDFGESNWIYKTLTASVFADQASATDGFQIQVSRNGTTWRTVAKATVAANTAVDLVANLNLRYARVVYTNGATATTNFELDSKVGVA